MSAPYRNPRVFLCPGDEGYLAYDTAGGVVHRLNPLASLIAELCDGRRSVEEIEALIAPILPEGTLGEIRAFIEQGLALGILATDAFRPSAPDPATVAEDLRNEGEYEAAYVCQFNATERAPDSPLHWLALGELAHITGRRTEARSAYERYLDLSPGDAEIRHRLIALRDAPPPARADNACIEQLYERFAPFYEANMLDDLNYQGPERLAALLADVMGPRDGLVTLDLGCGTGLVGMELRARCKHLVGIDLSPHMLELARARAVYDILELAEIGAWLGRCAQTFDLIVACDSLIYFGDLRPVIRAAASLLRPGGHLAFSLERGDRMPFRLNDNGRYSHHPDSLAELAAEAGLGLAGMRTEFLRMEYGQEVMALFVVLSLPGPGLAVSTS